MSTRTNRSGFSIVELVIAVVAVGVIGFLGYTFYNSLHSGTSTASTTAPTSASSQPPVASNVSSAPTISSPSDLDKALATLNQNDPSTANNSDSSQLTSQSNF